MGIPQESNTKVTDDMDHGLFQHTLPIPHLSASDGHVFSPRKELVNASRLNKERDNYIRNLLRTVLKFYVDGFNNILQKWKYAREWRIT
jgi:hypothetical protein